jgi:hypothetical protein
MRTQNQMLKDLMVSMWVTPQDALQFAKCARLAARVLELKRSGVQITDRWEKLPSGKRVKAYRVASSIAVPH